MTLKIATSAYSMTSAGDTVEKLAKIEELLVRAELLASSGLGLGKLAPLGADERDAVGLIQYPV